MMQINSEEPPKLALADTCLTHEMNTQIKKQKMNDYSPFDRAKDIDLISDTTDNQFTLQLAMAASDDDESMSK